MILAIAHLSQLKILLALAALENVEIRPDLPIYLLPRYPIALPHMSNEFLKVPLPVNHVFCPLLSMSINKYFPFRTAEKRQTGKQAVYEETGASARKREKLSPQVRLLSETFH